MTRPRNDSNDPGTEPFLIPSAPAQLDRIIGLLLFLLVVGCYLPALRNGFTNYDDNVYVSENLHVRTGLNTANIVEAFRSTEESGNWHPLTWLSHMLDSQIYGLRPWGHHLTNVLLHALNTALLYFIIKRMTGAAGRSLFVAALFGLHPLHVESVAWIAERKDVLSALFWMLTIGAYTGYVQSPTSNVQSRSTYYAVALLFFALGLLAKPMVVTLPCVLLLLDYWPLGRIGCWRTATGERQPDQTFKSDSFGRLMLEKIPFFVLAAVISVITATVQSSSGGVVAHLAPAVRAANTAVSYVRYLGKFAWPTDLAALYPLGPNWPAVTVVCCAVLLLAITAAAVAIRRHHPYLLVGWFWFLGTLVPVIGLFIHVGVQSIADRYTYLPSIGIFIMLAWGACALKARWRLPEFILPAAAAASVLACIVVTEHQIPFWKDSETLARRAVAVTENNFIAHNNLGAALDRQGHLDEALVEYQAAVNIKPGYLMGESNLGGALKRKGRYDDAIKAYRIFLMLDPNSATVHYNLGSVYEEKGDLSTAMAEYENALRLRPDYPEAMNNRAGIYGKQGKLDEAIAELQKVIALKPDYAEAHNNLGSAYAAKGRFAEAAAEFRAALKIKPGYTAAKENLEAAQKEIPASTNQPTVIRN